MKTLLENDMRNFIVYSKSNKPVVCSLCKQKSNQTLNIVLDFDTEERIDICKQCIWQMLEEIGDEKQQQ